MRIRSSDSYKMRKGYIAENRYYSSGLIKQENFFKLRESP